jgi:hypothetical protein
MPEATYYGYVPTDRPDYSALSQDLADKIYKGIEQRQEKREKLDEVTRANQKALDTWVPGKTQTLNEFVLNGMNDIRANLSQWNKDLKSGKMSESDFIRRNRNLEEYWGILSSAIKSQDERVDSVMQRQQPDENGKVPASSFEMELLKKFGEFTDIKDASIKVGSDGRVYVAKVDPNTGQLTDQVVDIRTINLPDNLISNKVDVGDEVDGIVKNWEPTTIWQNLGGRGEMNIESIRVGADGKPNPKYQMLLNSTANTIAPDSDPRRQLSVLIDNGAVDVPEFYYNENQRKQILDQKVQELAQLKAESGAGEVTPEDVKNIEQSMFFVDQNSDGVFTPVLTDEQKKLAKDFVKANVDLRFGDKISGTPPAPPSSRGGGSGGSGDGGGDKKIDTTKFTNMQRAWNSSNLTEINNQMSKEYRDQGYRIIKSSKVPGAYVLVQNVSGTDRQRSEPTKAITNDMLKYFFGGSYNAQEEGQKQKDAYWRAAKSQGSVPTQKPPSIVKQGAVDKLF